MKKIIPIVICLGIISIVLLNLKYITDTISSFITLNEPEITEKISENKKNYSLSYVSNTDSFIPYSNQDLMNIIYTTINNKWTNFTFYCPSEYTNCLNDIEVLSESSDILTHINNFVHPYNSFTSIKMIIADSGEINFKIDYLYEDDKIEVIDNEVKKIITDLIDEDDTDEEKIKTIHDYIIDNAHYDTAVNKNEETIYDSSTAYGPLFEGVAICNGYTDLMGIFLTEMGYENLKVATTPDQISYANTGHIWNIVKLDDRWLHIDVTWDDPLNEEDPTKSYLYHDYFLVTTDEMNEADERDKDAPVLEEHHFSTTVYYELK